MREVIIILGVLVGLAGTAGADKKTAMQLNVQGMKKYAKKDYSGAAELFEKAIKEDETLAYAHYNLASMASLNGDFDITIRELEWCQKSTDPIAAKLLAKGKTDKDLVDALRHPRVRELVGLPAFDKMTIDQIVLESAGVWGNEPTYCAGATLAITFKKGGKFAAKAVWGCNESYEKTSEAGTWAVKDGNLVLTPKKKSKIFDGQPAATLEACDDSNAKYGKCLVIQMDEHNQYYLRRGDQTY